MIEDLQLVLKKKNYIANLMWLTVASVSFSEIHGTVLLDALCWLRQLLQITLRKKK